RNLQRKIISLAVVSCFAAELAYANPTGPSVVAGQVGFATQGKLLSITNTPGSIINWQGFSIARDEITRFLQQSAASGVLNRVTGGDPSAILGALQSNGRVFLINPAGIMFGSSAQIDVAGLVASTLNLSDADFLAGRYRFTEVPGAGGIANQGSITTSSGGFVYLIAPDVSNSGIIKSPQGEILLAAGKSVELVNPLTPELRVQITAPDNEAVNVGQLIAQSGRIGMYAGLIRQGGVANANTAVMGENGKIVFRAVKDVTLEAGSVTTASGPSGGSVTVQSQTGTTLVAGSVEAKGLGSPPSEGGVAQSAGVVSSSEGGVAQSAGVVGKGGTVQILGNKVGLIDNARVDASGETGGGTVLVGGDYQGKNPDVQNASRTYVSADSTINANAIESGNGGKVVVWANEWTKYFGTIAAKGGAQSGDGGFVEVSGKGTLYFDGRVDTTAPNGSVGTLLLDPTTIFIAANQASATAAGMVGVDASIDGDATSPLQATGVAADSLLTTASLLSVLGGSDVIVSTVNATGLGTGDINVVDDISYTSATTRLLTLRADNTINFRTNANLTSSTGVLNVVLHADADNSGAGAIVMNTGSSIVSNGGNITLGGGADPALNPARGTATNQDGVSILGATVSSGAGNITINGQAIAGGAGDTSGVLITNSGPATPGLVSSTSGNISISGTGGGSAAGNNSGVVIHGNNGGAGTTTVSSATGDITIFGTGGTAGSAKGIFLGVAGRVETTGVGGDVIMTGNSGATALGSSDGVILGGSPGFNTVFVRATGGGNIQITGTSNATGGNDNRGVAVQFNGSFIETSSGNITINAVAGNGVNNNDGLTVHGARITTASGTISATATGNGTGATNHGVRLDSEAASGLGGTIEATGAGVVAITATPGTGGTGIISLDTGAVVPVNRIGSATMTGAVTLAADSMDIGSSTTTVTTAGTSSVTLRQKTNGVAVDIGGADVAGTTLGLTSAELNAVNTGTLKVGDANSGNLSVSAAIAPTGTTVLSLQTGGTITQTLGSTITETDLALRAGGAITLNEANDVTNLAANVTGASNSITFTNELNGFTVGTVDALSGITTADATTMVANAASSGSVTLSSSGAITVSQNVRTGNVTVPDNPLFNGDLLTSGSINVTAATGITGTAQLITGNASFTGATQQGADTATSGSITLNVTGVGDIGLSATNALTVGSASGLLVVDTVIGNMSLTADRIHNGSGGALSVLFGTGNGDINTPGQLSATTDGAGPAGDIRITSAAPLNLGAVSSSAGGGAIDIATTGAGNLLTVSGALASGGGNVTLTADDMAINSTVNAGAGAVTLKQANSLRAVDLGTNTGVALGLTDAELDTITAGILRIGDTANAGSITVSSAISAPAGWNTLHLRTGGAIIGNSGGTDLTVTNLALSAATGITNTVTTNPLTTAVSNLAFSNSTSGDV
ncbi:MAG: filamentous hemagglutinin N-terminal domain-containing protein, partial [Betaproteobacteria bacterium]|nr:filamentous hemagglutinin N-terminal domain-containing protein [Betaproteobacteria bacterium]